MYIFVFVLVRPPQAHVIGTQAVVNLDWWKKPRIKSRHSDVGQPMTWQKLNKIPPPYKCSAKAIIPMKTIWCRKAPVSYLLFTFSTAFGLFHAICFDVGFGVKDDNAHPLSRCEYAGNSAFSPTLWHVKLKNVGLNQHFLFMIGIINPLSVNTTSLH